jgi:anti-anti-sigma factor
MSPRPILEFASSTDPDGTAVLHVRGEVDLATAEQLRECLLAEFSRHHRLVLDLSRAMFYDGVALRALRALHHEAIRARREPPALRGVRPTLAKALKATGMHTLFPLQAQSPLAMMRAIRPRTQPSPMASAA